ncbi:MAG: hypothetical protein U0324_45325 [Polyangiales bacterium]
MTRCARAWQAEALRDGRLRGPERDGFERHRAACPACRAAGGELDALAAGLRALPEAPADELAARRTKLRLLRAWDDATLAPPRKAARWPVVVALVAGVAGAAAWRAHPRATTATARGIAPRPASSDPFAEALAALHAGRSTDAAERFEAIAAQAPAGPRAEDADYLAVVAWMRAGRPERVRDAARRYLARHGDGFRRREVEVVATMVGGDR